MLAMIRLDEVPVSERFDFWWEAVSRSMVPADAASADTGDFWGELRQVDLGAAQLSRLRCTPFEARRTPRRIREADPGLYLLSVTLGGRSTMRQRRREASLAPTDLVLYDTSEPFYTRTAVIGETSSVSVSDGLVLQFSRELLPLPSHQVDRLLATRLPGREGIAGLLSSMLLRLSEQQAPYAPADGIRVATVVIDLVVALLAQHLGTCSTAPLDDPYRVLVMRAQAFIEQRLGDADLTPSAVAAGHHISTRHLQKAFEREGLSVASWIRSRRLERCRRDLADPAMDRLPVGTIAARWGFPNESHFNRSFRAAYDTPPATYRRDLLNQGRAAAASLEPDGNPSVGRVSGSPAARPADGAGS